MKLRILLLLLLFIPLAFAQIPENIQRYRGDTKGNIEYRKKGLLDGNRVRTVFQNNGEVSEWFDGAVSAPHLEWPKGTGHRHLDGYTFMVGAKVKTSGGKTITPIETMLMGLHEKYYKTNFSQQRRMSNIRLADEK